MCTSGCTTSCFTTCKGTCSGTCSGTCKNQCSGCKGTCVGGCSSCRGTCSGTCTNQCSGCKGTCVGGCSSCQGACEDNCASNCQGTCSGTCSGGCNTGCISCRGCSGCENSCQGTCNATCNGGVQDTNIANLTLNEYFKAGDLNKIAEAIRFEVADRRGNTPQYNVTFNVGDYLDEAMINNILANLSQAGQSMDTAVENDIALKSFGLAIIEKIKAANNTVVGLP